MGVFVSVIVSVLLNVGDIVCVLDIVNVGVAVNVYVNVNVGDAVQVGVDVKILTSIVDTGVSTAIVLSRAISQML